jgi:hypothetical protein
MKSPRIALAALMPFSLYIVFEGFSGRLPHETQEQA